MKTFKDVPVYGLFQTGPASTLFIKISSRTVGDNSIDLSDGNWWDGHGKACWVPNERQVHILEEDEVVKVQSRWD